MTARPRSRGTAAEGPFPAVWALVRRIPRGRVATYGQLSALMGRRLTPVGIVWALCAAPEGLLPWHRVLNARGGFSTDGASPGLQRALLEGEGVVVGEDGCVDLARWQWRPRARPPARRPSARRPRH